MDVSTPRVGPRHPLVACADTIAVALDRVRGVDPTYLPTPDKGALLLALHRAEERLHGLKLQVLASADDVAEAHAARSPAAWLDKETASGRRAARRDEHLARALDRAWTTTGAALADGLLSRHHAAAIAASLDRLPGGLDPDLVAVCEKQLIGLADRFSPEELRSIGRTILSRVAPEVGEEHDRRALEAEERQARKNTWLVLGRAADGSTYLRGRIPDAAGGKLRRVLDGFGAPRQHGRHTGTPSRTASGTASAGTGEVDRLPADQRAGLALCALIERLPAEILPEQGGSSTAMTVLVGLDALVTGLGIASLDDGTPISAAEARRLACSAEIIPVVLGADSQPLDVGRAARLFSKAQRVALTIRDRHCRAAGCTIPAAWCEAHHLRPWSRGGGTDLLNGLLLCAFHHHRIHDERYEHDVGPHRVVDFHRRT